MSGLKSSIKIFESHAPFTLESGDSLPGVQIAYHTYGKPNPDRSNCIWVCHALTANSDVADWWPHTVEKNCFLDPEKYFIVCANIIGSCYGSTGPLFVNPQTGQPWYDRFPKLTIRDIVKAHILLADHLGIKLFASLIGSSVGGFQALEWSVMQPERFRSVVLIATDAYASPWTVAADETQRMAIFADKTYGEQRPDAATDGLAAARAIGMLTYRGASGYNASQQDVDIDNTYLNQPRRAATYQRHQGKKLTQRFDAYSYVTILNAFDTHNIGRGRGDIPQALERLSMPVLVVGITTDIIFTPSEMKRLADMIPFAEYQEIESAFGHDGFLVEHAILNKIITAFFQKNNI
ncbi:MAG: homoserine O-acetyltransferase [Muribaculaceae bacterium]|nr:homoserine O-acetyltransferase [Muribaculaceae bacterium]